MITFLLGLILLISPKQAAAEIDFTAFPQFKIGVANAPGHVEDQLNDMWLDAASRGEVAGWNLEVQPELRLEFWTHPEKEIDLIAKSGAKLFRMGIDWGRVTENGFDESCLKNKGCHLSLDPQVLARYRQIIELARGKGLNIMLTLFHHSEPLWALPFGGLQNKRVREEFEHFSLQIFKEFKDIVDYWITFNEPTLYGVLTQLAGIWPSNTRNPGPWQMLTRVPRLRKQMIKAHRNLYQKFKKIDPNAKIGLAKRIDYYFGDSKANQLLSRISHKNFNLQFLDKTWKWMDFIGINYYGIENVKGLGISFHPKIEYTEAGRGIFPGGLPILIKELHQRYNIKRKRSLPFIITENGIADATDWVRPAYMTEHLAAIASLLKEGIPIEGYIFWTITDNLEWGDGYCPKFGMVEIDRANQIKRIPRPSFELFREIATKRQISAAQREAAWSLYKSHWGDLRPFCRADDAQTSLPSPVMRELKGMDWRFVEGQSDSIFRD